VTVLQPVMVSPQQINLPPGPLTSAVSPMIMIRSTGTNTLALSDPVVDFRSTANAPVLPDPVVEGKGPEVAVQEVQPGHVFNLTVHFPAGFQVKPNQKAELRVKSNHPKVPLITVPIFQMQTTARSAAAQNAASPVRVLAPPPTSPAPPQK